jgi:hypothetical protein
VQLTDDDRCALFGDPRRPAFCDGLQPSEEMCGASREYALAFLARLEEATKPAGGPLTPGPSPPLSRGEGSDVLPSPAARWERGRG